MVIIIIAFHEIHNSLSIQIVSHAYDMYIWTNAKLVKPIASTKDQIVACHETIKLFYSSISSFIFLYTNIIILF